MDSETPTPNNLAATANHLEAVAALQQMTPTVRAALVFLASHAADPKAGKRSRLDAAVLLASRLPAPVLAHVLSAAQPAKAD